jgi:hypothetical protein
MGAHNGTMRSIWYFVGLMLVTSGGLVLAAGIGDMVWPPEKVTVLAGIRPALWWSAIMIVAGTLFLLANRKRHHRVHDGGA